eukprot:Selendium_serpulae@DN5971_c0_g1_i2.p3
MTTDGPPPPGPEADALVEDLRTNLHAVRAEVVALTARLSDGRAPPVVLPVTKMVPVWHIKAAYDLGEREFGENYVQQLVEKASLLPKDIKWHMIGQLQSNKCKALLGVDNVTVVESVDSVSLAEKLQTVCELLDRRVGVLVQVNTSAEDTKSGALV